MTKTLTPSQMVNMGGGPIENPAIMGINHGQPGMQNHAFMHNPQMHHETYKPPHQPLANPLRIPPNDIDAYFNSNKPLREFYFVLAFVNSVFYNV